MIQILGDPHLGRVFTNGVPLHRRGEREEMVWRDFTKSLLSDRDGVDLHINLGDLFDAAIVPYDVLIRAALTYQTAATRYPDTTFVILRGNHDLLRDLEKSSAFDIFAELMKPYKNVVVVKDKPVLVGHYAFAGFHPLTPAGDLLTEEFRGCQILFGHYDVEAFGSGHTPNLVPTKRAAELGIPKIVTGHVHKSSTVKQDGVEVVIHGSMQPYAHGQEADGDTSLYVQLGLADALSQKDELVNKHVKIYLQPGETLEEEIDCLQLLLVYPENSTGEVLPAVEVGEFNLLDLLKEALTEAAVNDKLQERVFNEFSQRRLSGTA